MGINGVDIFAIGCLLFIFLYLSYIIYYAIGLYDLNPFIRPKALNENDKYLIRNNLPWVKELNAKEIARLYKRVAWFRAKKTFTYKAAIPNTHQIELLISAAAVLLTLGLRKYKYLRSVHKIIIYPSDYYSVINKKQHLGEFNWGLKTVVFAADAVYSGFENATDNLNLAFHEFAHALYFDTKGRNSWEALRFQWGFRKLEKIFNEKKSRYTMDESHLRPYAMTNNFEFFAVVLEHFFENPRTFRSEKPEVFHILSKMLNRTLT